LAKLQNFAKRKKTLHGSLIKLDYKVLTSLISDLTVRNIYFMGTICPSIITSFVRPCIICGESKSDHWLFSLKRRAALVELECAILHEVNLLEVGNSFCQDKPPKGKKTLKKLQIFNFQIKLFESVKFKVHDTTSIVPKKNPPLNVILLVKEELP
jgi:hypothetical protein